MLKRKLTNRQNRVPPVSRLILFLNSIIKRKAQAAAYSLSQKVEKLTTKQIQKYLCGFTLLSISLNVLIVISALKNPSVPTIVQGSRLPGEYHVFKGDARHKSNDAINYQQVLRLEVFLDSLQKTESGKKQYDSFLLRRPHFRDSVELFKHLYSNH